MWVLRYTYQHNNCRYSPKVKELGITFYWRPLTTYVRGDFRYLAALHTLEGTTKAIREYIQHIKKMVYRVEQVSENMLFTLTRVPKHDRYYQLLYDQSLFYVTPVVHKDGLEHAHIMSWEREPLEVLVHFLQRDMHTTVFKLEAFKEEQVHNMLLVHSAPAVTAHQREVFDTAVQSGYYSYPRGVGLQQLARQLGISKSSAHEALRRAEANIFTRQMLP